MTTDNKDLDHLLLECWVENRIPILGFQVIGDVLLNKAIADSAVLQDSTNFWPGHPPRNEEGRVDWDLVDTDQYRLVTHSINVNQDIITKKQYQEDTVQRIKLRLEEAVARHPVINGTVKIMADVNLPNITFVILYLENKNDE